MQAPLKKKILNDPVYGFINLPGGFVFELIEHPWIQRLRHIKQLGLSGLVYPGANHCRFQHSLGALYLTSMAVETLRSKGVDISEEEEEAVLAAVLLHDIGHGPFSHALEKEVFDNVDHEEVSLLLMELLNKEFNGRLTLAITIFKGKYKRKFLHELLASQIDMDRLDYLRRDSFFTGVIEGSVGSSRIIRMLNVVDDHLVVEEKGIYSIEKFLIARRLMYWQVYMHKTVISAERLVVNIFRRARELALQGESLHASPALKFFLDNKIGEKEISGQGAIDKETIAEYFTSLDDNDILSAAKVWSDHGDDVLSQLCKRLKGRDLFAVELNNEPFPDQRIALLKRRALDQNVCMAGMEEYFVFTGSVSNLAYAPDAPSVKILLKSGEVRDVISVSDMLDHNTLSERTTKYFLCYPKELRR